MERFFRLRDPWGNRAPFWIVMLCLFSLPLLGLELRSLRLENDVTRWLPEDDPDARVLAWFDEEFEHDSSLLFTWESSTLHDPRLNTFAAVLKKGPGGEPIQGLKEVTTPRTVLARMKNNGIEDKAAIERLTGLLIGSGFLKVRLSDGVENSPDVRAFVQLAAAEFVGMPVHVLPPAGAADFQPEESAVDHDDESDNEDENIDCEIAPHDLQLRWATLAPGSQQSKQLSEHLEGLSREGQNLIDKAFFQAGAPVALTIAVNEYGSDNLVKTVGEIRGAAVEAGIPEEEIRMGGTPVARQRLNREALRAVWNRDYPIWNLYRRSPVLLCGIVGIVTSFVLLRSVWLSCLVVLSSIYCCLLVLALVPLTGHALNIILILLPDLLLVLTMSGAIHIANYWKYATARGMPNPVQAAVRMGWVPCALASITTGIGMASLMTSILKPVRMFGAFSSVGCLVSLVVIVIIFPSALSLLPPRSRQTDGTQRDVAIWGRLGEWLARHRISVSVLCLAVFLGSLAGLQRFQTETRVIRYFPEKSRIVEDYNYLEQGLAGIVSIEAVVRFDETAREKTNVLDRMRFIRDLERDIAAHPWVSGTISLADFRPEVSPPGEDASTRAKVLYMRRAQRTEEGIFEEQVQASQRFTKLADRGINVNTANLHFSTAPGDEVWRIRAQAAVMGQVDYDRLTSELTEIVSQAISSQTGTAAVISGMVPLFLRTQNAVLESLIESFGLAFGLVALVMIVLLRNPISGLLAMLPNLFPVGIVFGLVSWGGIPVDIGTMITASVALGIAVDGTLHLITWFRDGIREGLSREEAVKKSLAYCGPAMWQTSVAISLGILMLSGAELLLIHRFGWLMASLILVALIGDVILLPALLAGWLGKIIQSQTEQKPADDETAPVSELLAEES